jgi:Ca-activated chloride channel family protein
MSVQVLNPIMLHGLWAVGALSIVGALALLRAQRRLARLADSPLLRELAPGRSPGRAWLRLLCAALSLTLVVVALADVRWGVVTVEARRRGLDVVFLLDLSRSMLAEDARPNRLERAKQIINDVVDRLPGERVALIGFAGDAALACPLTLNHDAFTMALEDLDPRDSGRGGSLPWSAASAGRGCSPSGSATTERAAESRSAPAIARATSPSTGRMS